MSAATLWSGCSTVIFVREPKARQYVLYTKPAYERSEEFFLFSLVGGTRTVDVTSTCLGKPIDQLATTYKPSDLLVALLTFGIYTPRTAQVWCSL